MSEGVQRIEEEAHAYAMTLSKSSASSKINKLPFSRCGCTDHHAKPNTTYRTPGDKKSCSTPLLYQGINLQDCCFAPHITTIPAIHGGLSRKDLDTVRQSFVGWKEKRKMPAPTALARRSEDLAEAVQVPLPEESK